MTRADLPPMVKRPGWGYSPDGLWTFERHPSGTWEREFVPTGQYDSFPTLRDARRATVRVPVDVLQRRAAAVWADRRLPEPKRQQARRQWRILEHLVVWGMVPVYVQHTLPDGSRCPWSGVVAHFSGQCRSWRCGSPGVCDGDVHRPLTPPLG